MRRIFIIGRMNRAKMGNGCNKTLVSGKAGQSMVEFAMILPLMVLFVAGIFDLGRAFFSAITIANAAREGARFATINPTDSQGICIAAHDEAQSSQISILYNNINILCGTSNVTCQSSGTTPISCPVNQPVIVRVSYDYNDMILKFFFPNPIHMAKQVEMLVP